MVLLRALTRTTRMIRHAPRLAEALTADSDVLLDAPDERLAPALRAAAHGDHGPAAKLLAASREAAEWENRDRYVLGLTAFARRRPEWLTQWRAEAPLDPDVALLRAELAMRRGWESPARATLLREVAPLVAVAADAAPRDPVPWRIALDHARGAGASYAVFDELWAEAVRRSPHHYGCHAAALQYLSATWYGSHRGCFDFAERAAADALPGSLVQALPVRAAFAFLQDPGGGGSGGGSAGASAAVPTERLDAAADRAIALSDAYERADPYPAEVRNLLAYVLVRLGRPADALEQLRLIGPYATSFPWNLLSGDPLGHFLEVRDGVRLQVAAMTPLRRRIGLRRPGPP
ncbi:hypothetical protein [Streptomyces apocyni]|uniref:hypothetical protein n=1 Tax=Streptomyces apocyni TaxID=2654677 RepID=UPI0012EA5223|nr:hypothetical protein [Streptomyces apocyni]